MATTHSDFIRTRAALRGAVMSACVAALAACTITLPPPHGAIVVPSVPSMSATEYRAAVAQCIADRNSDRILHGTPQAMLRSLVVVAFTVDRNGQLVKSAVYRSNGDDEAEGIALASLRRAAPLPSPPTKMLDGRGQVELMESWLFNDNGQFQLRTKAAPQAQTLN
ncbi:energy transducer TonB family protein [Burkholderia oklahomensis]|uniref:energy transducer TonB family protein n=1 Tax=Burkholderia oklahomensis TaxID=342113 RepID=UPI0002E2AF65|nr:energy transducer TonB [Burkholderia oklahomensis]AOI41620.1 energy transducer TonB [Burkholderia oklahomensis EO147]AOI45207.1 energy transducer TonB [Burkholderia oklahomensis C6786]KUY59510.1 energy transducer TonB [Burkholderia oklahomensis C6786]KUY69218.1 energy transducer TonB [Burkholderia oklahomensis EO147]MBI0358732.1 energy transducer TonB [Burkholderia oklahomensis]